MNFLRRLLGHSMPESKVPRASASPGRAQRHQILGRELVVSRDETLKVLAEGEASSKARIAAGQRPQQFTRQMQLEKTVIYAVLEHLGYGPIDRLLSRLQAGVDLSVEYYCGEWWRRHDEDGIALDKSRSDRELRWFEVLPNALLLCGLTGRWDEAARICSWFDETLQIEERFELNDYEFQWLYLCIVSSLRPQPLEWLDVEKVLASLAECRPKRPRLLGALWQTVLSGDQDAFEKALKESVRHFLKSPQQVPNCNLWIARDESVMALIAERKGLEVRGLPEKVEAAVVRRQTVGLA